MSTYDPTCPTWCDQDHTPYSMEPDHTGHVEHKRVIPLEDVTVDLVQYIEWQLDHESSKWIITTHPPAAVLGPEFDNAESLNLQKLGARMRALESAYRELALMGQDFAKEEQQ